MEMISNIIWKKKNDFIEEGVLEGKRYMRRIDNLEIIHSTSEAKGGWRCVKCGTETNGVQIMPAPFYRNGRCSAGLVTNLPFCEVCEPEFMTKLAEEYVFDNLCWIKK